MRATATKGSGSKGENKMLAFSQGLKEEIISGTITHSTNLEGLEHILRNLDETSNVACSTKGTIDRGIEIYINVNNKKGLYCDYDADAGKNFGYDEFRCFFTELELHESIEKIIVCDDIMEEIENNDCFYDFLLENRLIQKFQIKNNNALK